MIGIMSDHDILGLANALFLRCRDEWSEFFDDLDVRIVTFEDLDLASDASLSRPIATRTATSRWKQRSANTTSLTVFLS